MAGASSPRRPQLLHERSESATQTQVRGWPTRTGSTARHGSSAEGYSLLRTRSQVSFHQLLVASSALHVAVFWCCDCMNACYYARIITNASFVSVIYYNFFLTSIYTSSKLYVSLWMCSCMFNLALAVVASTHWRVWVNRTCHTCITWRSTNCGNNTRC